MNFGSVHAAYIFAIEVIREETRRDFFKGDIVKTPIWTRRKRWCNEATSLFIICASHHATQTNVTDSAQSFRKYETLFIAYKAWWTIQGHAEPFNRANPTQSALGAILLSKEEVECASGTFDRESISSLGAIVPRRAWYSSNIRSRTIETSWARTITTWIIRTFFTYHSSFAGRWSACVRIEHNYTSFHSWFAIRTDLAFMRHWEKQSKIVYVISLSARKTIRAFHAFDIWGIQLFFITNMAWRTCNRFIHSSERAHESFWAWFASCRHCLILVITDWTSLCRLIECASWAVMCSGAFLNSMIQARKTRRALIYNRQQYTWITLCF